MGIIKKEQNMFIYKFVKGEHFIFQPMKIKSFCVK